ncbi:MAG: hypothetical protein DI626_01545 [Micavibrio aeruginosavorus]|uniref:Mechanosensitive ion channel MscS domain-containing protein n=1 Tax=Micavibrio aeruginosavorus TaxID=349221 RepID=A0A2W5A1Y4_9BACT|nr:MAG: hypothetical protein DI626_01545 [Micavibrio aeruginosavorus]
MDIIEYMRENDLNAGWETAVVAGLAVLGLALFYVIKRYIWTRVVKREGNFVILLYHRFNRPLQLLMGLTAAVIILNKLYEDIGEEVWYQKTYSILVITIIAWMAIRAIGLTSDWFLGRFDVGVRDNLKARRIHTQIKVLRRLAVSLIVIVGLASCLMVFDQIRSLGVSLIASAGLAGIVLGLAAQKTLGNFFTGLQIAITQPIRIGDAVIVEGEWGVIEEINLTYVVVKIWDLRRLVLPISYFVDKPFQNWTRTSADLLGVVMLYLDYSMPVDALRGELVRILAEPDVAEKWDGKVQVVQVVEATERTMQIRVLVSAADAPTAFDLRCMVRERLIKFVQENHAGALPRLRADAQQDAPEKENGGTMAAIPGVLGEGA